MGEPPPCTIGKHSNTQREPEEKDKFVDSSEEYELNSFEDPGTLRAKDIVCFPRKSAQALNRVIRHPFGWWFNCTSLVCQT